MTPPTRTYTKGSLSVEWRPELCVHCQKCIQGLPEVFDMDKKPWVDLTRADDSAIINQVLECPSGALTYTDSEEADFDIAIKEDFGDPDFHCHKCGVETTTAPLLPKLSVCENCCEDHEYEYDSYERAKFCIHCNKQQENEYSDDF